MSQQQQQNKFQIQRFSGVAETENNANSSRIQTLHAEAFKNVQEVSQKRD